MKDYKVVTVGESGVGKTSIIERFVQGSFNENVMPSVGSAFVRTRVKTESNDVYINLWDTAGQEKYQSLIPLYVRNAVACLFVFSMADLQTLHSLDQMWNDIKEIVEPNTIMYLIGNKIDLLECDDSSEQIKISEEANQWALSHGGLKYFQVSAKSGQGIQLLFENVAQEVSRPSEQTYTESKAVKDIIGSDTQQTPNKCC